MAKLGLGSLTLPLCVFCGLVVSAFDHADAHQANQASTVRPGVVVERVTKGTEAELAGIKPGDVLVSWTRGNAKGEIDSPFDLPYLRFEQASRGTVTIEGVRASKKHVWFLGSKTWGIAGRPNLTELFWATLQHELQLAETKDAAARWKKAAMQVSSPGSPEWLRSWFLMRTAQVLFDAQQWDAAESAYREATEQARFAGPIVRAELLRQLAVGFDYRGDLANAEKYFEELVAEWQKVSLESMSVAHYGLELGVVALNRGDHVKAEWCFQRALAITEKLAPASSDRAVSLANLGVVYDDRGEMGQAEEYYRQALTIEEEYFPRSYHLSRTLANIGTLTGQRGDWARAREYYQKALAIIEGLESSGLETANILSYLAQCAFALHDPVRAEGYERRSLSIRAKLAPGSVDEASSLANLGRIARIRGDLVTAETLYRQALSIGEKMEPPRLELASVLIGSGNMLREKGDLVGAEESYRRALAIMEKIAPGYLDYGETLAALAATLRKRGQSDDAAQLYHKALQDLESKTAHLGGVEVDRYRYRAKQTSYYTEYMDLLMEQGQLETAFEVLEGSRGRTLLETLSRSQVDIREGVDASLLDRERNLRQSLNAKTQYRIRLLNGEHTGAQLAAIDADVAELLDRYQQIEAEVRTKSPKYAALTQPQPLSTMETQRMLEPETILLEYSLGEERSFVWVVGQDSLAAYELPKRAEIESLARRAYQLLTARNSHGPKGETETETEARWAKADADYFKTATNLSRIVLGPVAGLLQGKRLLIVSDGALQYIPFSALPTPDKPQIPLILEHEIVNLPSASVVAELRRTALGRKEAPKAVAVLADPVFDLSDERLRKKIEVPTKDQSARLGSWSKDSLSAERLTRSVADVGLSRGGQFHLTRLLYSRQEAEAIMAVTPAGKGMKVLDFNANRAAATSAELAQYRIVHFATHGLLDNKHPELSGLVFSMVNRQGKPQDGFLQLADIYNLNLPVELVVLSACETGLGEEISGEGLIGLTRGFMYAGASRVVASLWKVSDVGTSELMAHFYKAMEQDKLRPAAGLRAAQIQMWKQKQWRSPYYWAAFQLQGEWK